MKYSLYMTAILTLVFSASAMADAIYTAQGTIPLPTKETMKNDSENTTGNKQQTIVDQNGSLKIVENTVNPAPERLAEEMAVSPQAQIQPGPSQPDTEQSVQPQPSKEQSGQPQPGQMQSGQPQPEQMQQGSLPRQTLAPQTPGIMQPGQSQSSQMLPGQEQPAKMQSGQSQPELPR